jgi:Mce-associated membrane protein
LKEAIIVATAEKDTEKEPEQPDVEDTESGVEDSDPEIDALLAKPDDSKRPWGQYLRRSIVPLVLVAALAVSGFLGWQQWQQHRVTQAGQQAQQAAIGYAQVLTSIDSSNVDQNFRQVLDGATGEFKDMYTQSSVQLRQLLIENKATAHGVAVDSAIQSASPDKVVVLLFIDQTVTNSQLPDPRIDRSRIKMTMEKVNGRWLAAKVQLL